MAVNVKNIVHSLAGTLAAPVARPQSLMKIFFLTWFAAALLMASPASAQTTFHFGLRAGAHRANTTLDNRPESYEVSYSAEKSALFAWQAGVVLDVRFAHLTLQPALVFSQKGGRTHTLASVSGVAGFTYFETSTTNRSNWIELPLNVLYAPPGGRGLHVFAGPYAAAQVGGRERGTVVTYTVFSSQHSSARRSEEFNTPAYSTYDRTVRWDAGLNAGVGYRHGPLQVQLGYGLGLLDLHPTDSPHTRATRNRVAQLTATYFVPARH